LINTSLGYGTIPLTKTHLGLQNKNCCLLDMFIRVKLHCSFEDAANQINVDGETLRT